MSNFTLSFHIPLEPKQLVMAGGDQDPLGKTFNTAVAEQYEVCLFNPKEPVLPDVDFLLDSDETIVPGMSPGKRDTSNSIFLLTAFMGVPKEAESEFV